MTLFLFQTAGFQVNAKTLHRLPIPVPFLLVLIVIGIFSESGHWLRTVAGIATLVFICLGILGAVMGLLFAFGQLHLGCPRCSARSKVVGGTSKGMVLDCPHCGLVRIGKSLFGKIRCEVVHDE